MFVAPVRDFRFDGRVPGDKSVTHRAVMLGGAAEGTTAIERPLLSLDTLATADCMQKLGAKVEEREGALYVTGAERFHSGETLDCRNSGTTMRLLTGLLAGRGASARLVGDDSLSHRPMGRVIRPLSALGASIHSQNGCAPLDVAPGTLTGAEVKIEVPSAQVKSAVLLAGLGAKGETTVKFTTVTRDHTERMLKGFGADIAAGEGYARVRPSRLTAQRVEVCGDISSAAYPFAAAALLGGARVAGVGVNPTRAGILTVLQNFGARVTVENTREVCGEPVADVTVSRDRMRPVAISGALTANVIDELPVIAVLCCFAQGESVIEGAGELRVKESDRIALIAEMLRGLGGEVEELPDGLRITGHGGICGSRDFVVDPRGDHRIAMSAAVAALASDRGCEISDLACADVSFPGFAEAMGCHA